MQRLAETVNKKLDADEQGTSIMMHMVMDMLAIL
jgi:hypothetical protein